MHRTVVDAVSVTAVQPTGWVFSAPPAWKRTYQDVNVQEFSGLFSQDTTMLLRAVLVPHADADMTGVDAFTRVTKPLAGALRTESTLGSAQRC